MDLIYVIKIIYALRLHSRMKVKRSFSDLLADRIVQAGTESSLLAFVEKLAKLIDSDMGEIYSTAGVDFLIIQKNDGQKYLNWLRQYPRIAAMIACLKWEDAKIACEQIQVDETEEQTGTALPQGNFDIPINFTTLSPLAHGSDTKAGNATLFRRMQIISNTGKSLTLPFYAGNAFRGEMRDLLADHFLKKCEIDFKRKAHPLIKLWFFHVLYSGGALDSENDSTKAMSEAMGKNGAIRAEGVHQFRDTLPALSLLGCALGNRILSGRVNFSDFRPECMEWGNGVKPVGQLFEWLYLTRREDHEGHEDGENSSMIANTECIKAGVKFYGGIDVSHHISDLEKSALGMGLFLMQEKGYIGADNRRGFGKIQIEIKNIPDHTLYENYLIENKNKIDDYLRNVVSCRT